MLHKDHRILYLEYTIPYKDQGIINLNIAIFIFTIYIFTIPCKDVGYIRSCYTWQILHTLEKTTLVCCDIDHGEITLVQRVKHR